MRVAKHRVRFGRGGQLKPISLLDIIGDKTIQPVRENTPRTNSESPWQKTGGEGSRALAGTVSFCKRMQTGILEDYVNQPRDQRMPVSLNQGDMTSRRDAVD